MNTETPKTFWSVHAVFAAWFWLYSVTFALWFASHSLPSHNDDWDRWSIILVSVHLAPVILIPAWLIPLTVKRRPVRFAKWFRSLIGAACLPLLLAMLDAWSAGSARGKPLFSVPIWKMSDGGTTGYFGPGYIFTYYRRMGGERGPEFWFWFSPVQLRYTTKRIGFEWLFTESGTPK